MAASPEMPDIGFLEKLTDFQAPSQVECVNHLAGVSLIVSIPMAMLGVVYLLLGWKLHKPLVTANAIVAGALIGSMLSKLSSSENPNVLMFASIAGGLLLGLLAMILMHGAVSVMGILAGGAIGFGAWTYIARVVGNPALLKYPWAGALVGLVALGLLAFANFRLAVMIFTAFQGSVMIVAGTTAAFLYDQATAATIRQGAQTNEHLLAALVGVPAVVGFVVQYAAAAKKIKKKLKSSSGG
ncbi:MAG: TM7S3/TM198-like domain-containing protein [Planctomycetota bacterium]|jgi:hypothetical protein